MGGRSPRWVVLTCALATSACGTRARPNATRPSVVRPVNGTPLATVAGESVTAPEVLAVARAEAIRDPRAALERTIALRLMAREAVRRGLDRDPLLDDLARRAAIQSLLTQTIERDNRVDTLSPADMQTGMRLRGFALAHGELWRTTHALVTVPRNATPGQRATLRARAESGRAAIVALPQPRAAAFRETATRAMQGVASRIEDLPAFDREGQFGRGDMVPSFTAAAVQLQHPGDVSPVVETEFGYHVIMLVERQPPLVRPIEEVRAIVTQELLMRVQHNALDRMLAELRQRFHAEIHDDVLPRVDRMPWGAESAGPAPGGT